MRKIRLSDTDGALFDEEMIVQDYEYLAKHKATFCRMWTEQGRKFWWRYVEVFHSYILRYSMLRDLTYDAAQLQGTLEFAFVVITTHFIEGKVNQAKSFLNQIADLGRNRHRFVYLDSKSVIKDPFYTKETRDIFREFFGPANEKSSYIKVYLLTPVYMKFGGSVVRCLTKWMEAEEIDPDDDSYYVRPFPIEMSAPLCTKHARSSSSSSTSSSSANVLCAYHFDDCNHKFYIQFVKGVPTTPVHLGFWEKKDPRFCEPENPLWNPDADIDSDWRDGLTIEDFRKFYAWCSLNDAIVNPQNQCQDCRARRKAKKKNKKKKKKASNLADFGYDDVSIAIDSGESWGGSNTEVKSKLMTAAKMGDKGCQRNRIGSTSDDDWLDYEPFTQPLRLRLMDQAIPKDAFDILSPCNCDDLMAEERLKTLHQNEKLDRKGLEKQIAMLCSGEVDCHCTLCVIDRHFNDSLLDQNSDSSSDSAGSADGKLADKEDEGLSAGPELDKSNSALVEEGRREKPSQKVLFGKNTEVKKSRDAVKLPLGGRFGDLRAFFDVRSRSDPDHGAAEDKVTLVEVGLSPGMPDDMMKRGGTFGNGTVPTLTPQYLSQTVKGLPATFCAEGKDWCLTEVDYSKLEKTTGNEKPTHFVLRISSAHSSDVMKSVMIEMLRYVVRRKKRPSVGWVPNQDDIFAFHQSLGAQNSQLKGVTYVITTGGSAVDVMTPEEFEMVMQSKTVAPLQTSSATAVSSELPAIPADRPGASKTKKKKKKNKNKNKEEGEETAEVTSDSNIKEGEKGTEMSSNKQAQDDDKQTQDDDKQAQDDDKADDTMEPGSERAAADSFDAETPADDRPPVRSISAIDSSPDEKEKGKLTNEQNSRQNTGKTNKMIEAIDDVSTNPSQVSALDGSSVSKFGLDSGGGDAGQASGKVRSFSVCSNCGIKELAIRSFKKCSKCKEQKVANARYYCGVPCQQAHWKSQHCQEHAQGTL